MMSQSHRSSRLFNDWPFFHRRGMTTKNSANDWRNYACRPRFTLMDIDFSCSVDLSPHKKCVNWFLFSYWHCSYSMRSRAYDISWSCVRPSVCLSHHATAAPMCGGFATDHWAPCVHHQRCCCTGHSTALSSKCKQCHVHSSRSN